MRKRGDKEDKKNSARVKDVIGNENNDKQNTNSRHVKKSRTLIRITRTLCLLGPEIWKKHQY